jgi:hypothetical protein
MSRAWIFACKQAKLVRSNTYVSGYALNLISTASFQFGEARLANFPPPMSELDDRQDGFASVG